MTLRRSILASGAMLSLGVMAGAIPAWSQTPADAGPLTIYNAQHASLTKAWADAFTAETGIKTILRNGSDTELGNQIVQEGAASPADVFLTENSPAMALVDNAGLFTPLPAAILDEVPASFRPSNGHWVGVAARSTVFAYNKSKFKPGELPASIMDLAEPAWTGRWGAAPAGADFQAIVSAILELKGEAATLAWLKGMKTNVVPFRSNSIALKGVNAGQVDGAIIYHYYYVGDSKRTGENTGNSELHYFRKQDPGAFVSISGGGVLATSKHKDGAMAFLKWVAGKGGQSVLRTGDSYEYAVGKGEASNPALMPLDQLQAPSVDPLKLNSRKVTELMTQAGLL